MKTKLTVLALSFALSGCAFLTNRAKRDVLQSADKELDSLISDHNENCQSFGDRLKVLKAKVRFELEKVK